MMMTRSMLRALAGCAALMLVAEGAAAQSLARRVAAIGDGTAQLRFPSQSGVCGDGRGSIRAGRSTITRDGTNWSNNAGWEARCAPGPVRVLLTVRDRTVSDVRTSIGGDDTRDGTTDLGTVSAAEGSSYLLSLAASADGRASERAIFPALLADVDAGAVWPALLRIARDSVTRSRSTRGTATLWLGFAAASAQGGRSVSFFDERADDDDEDSDTRGQAIFALSQLKHHEGVPALIDVARTNKDARLRRKAMFWLGQSGDARALDFFEQALSRR